MNVSKELFVGHHRGEKEETHGHRNDDGEGKPEGFAGQRPIQKFTDKSDWHEEKENRKEEECAVGESSRLENRAQHPPHRTESGVQSVDECFGSGSGWSFEVHNSGCRACLFAHGHQAPFAGTRVGAALFIVEGFSSASGDTAHRRAKNKPRPSPTAKSSSASTEFRPAVRRNVTRQWGAFSRNSQFPVYEPDLDLMKQGEVAALAQIFRKSSSPLLTIGQDSLITGHEKLDLMHARSCRCFHRCNAPSGGCRSRTHCYRSRCRLRWSTGQCVCESRPDQRGVVLSLYALIQRRRACRGWRSKWRRCARYHHRHRRRRRSCESVFR